MSRLGINTGSNANDGQGDTLRTAMGKINNNFLEIYTTLGDTNNVISYANTAGISTVARNLTGNPIINVGGVLNSGITTTEHLEVRNITSTGIITAVQFVGDGSQLTDVVATNPGVEILDNSVRRGVAREIDFGANIIATAPDGQGRVTITVPTGSESTLYANLAGVATYASVAGLATHASSSDVSAALSGTPNVTLNSVTAGVVTATSFIGDGSGLTGVIAEGTGIRLEDDAVIIGVANTINFGSNLSVGPIINGRTTISGSGIATALTGSPNITVSNILAGVVTATSFSGDGSNLTGIPRGYWTKGVGLSTTDNVGIGTTAKSNYVLDVVGNTGESVSIASTIITIGNMTYVNNRWRVPNWLNIVSGGGSGVSLTQLDDEDFVIQGFGKSRYTFQIGTSFYTNDEGIADPKAGVFIDGSRSTIAVGYGITMNGISGIITANAFFGSGANLTGIVTGGDIELAVNLGLVGYATEGYVTDYVSDYRTSVGLVTSGYVDTQIGIRTFSGDYYDLTNRPTINQVYVLADLDDVNAASPTPGQVLKWSGTQWVAGSDLTGGVGGSGIGLTDLSVTQSSPGIASLTYSNSTGVFTYTPPNLTGYATTSALVGLVSTTDLAGYATTSSLSSALVGLVSTTDLVGYATSSWVTAEIGSYGYASQSFVIEQVGLNTFVGAARTITNTDISNWNTSYGWGNHATAGYLTSYTETDTLSTILSRGNSANYGISLVGVITATQFIKPGGTSSQFLKADGSVDGNTYLSTNIFDQNVNTTDDVTFNSVGIISSVTVGAGSTLSVTIDNGNITLAEGTQIADIGLSGSYSGLALGNNRFQVSFGSTLNDWAWFYGADLIQFQADTTVNLIGNVVYISGGVEGPQWQFDSSGNLTFPDSTVQTTAYTGSVGSAGTWAVNPAGIHTSKNVGIGTELSSSALWVEGNGYFSGIVTATRFESASAGTPSIDSPNNLNINAINVAISTDLSVGGDAYVGVDTSSGLVLTSPNGTQYRLVVDNSGNLSTVLVP